MARYASGENQPLTHWKNFPIYLTTILTAVFVVALFVQIISPSLRFPWVALISCPMPFRPVWMVWRPFTYVLVGQMSLFTPFAIACFYWWSLGVETHLGRGILTKLLLLLALSGPVVGAVWWWGLKTPTLSVGSYEFTGGLLIAFATLYPNAEAWGWIPFKWFAFACIFCGSLMLLAQKEGPDWVALSQLWTACAVGFAYIRNAKELEYDDYESPLTRFKRVFARKPKFRVLPSPRAAAKSSAVEETSGDVDALLDKIAKSGMASLTPKERARLEKASETLRKDKR
jgi:hypothetical protein